jgi:membrane-associated protease RseP (regulator of RpoE activity)
MKEERVDFTSSLTDRIQFQAHQLTRNRNRIWLHVLLFVLTCMTTFLMGLSDGLLGAFAYSGGIMTILLTHELGHYLMARKYRVPATLPYFIPLPLPPFGTMGAVIKMGGYIPDRRALFDIGAAGPFAGFVMILPAIVIGLKLSQVQEVASLGESSISLGDSLLFTFLARIVKGPLEPGKDIILHPLAFAGWVGLLVTALNLLPIGQLDGGHIMYALFWKKSKIISILFYITLLIICLFFYFGWFLLVVVLAVIRKHPPTQNDSIPLDRRRKLAGLFAIFLFILAFTPVPFGFGEGLIPMILDGFHP